MRRIFHNIQRVWKMELGFALAVLAFGSCSNEDWHSLFAVEIPSAVAFNFTDAQQQLIYTDATGMRCLPMVVGDTTRLNYTLEPDSATSKDVVWSSSDTDVAVVDNGLITAVSGNGRGYSVVEVAPEGVFPGSGISDDIKIVVSNEMRKADSMSIWATAHELYAGDTLHMSLTTYPDNTTYKTAQWTVSDDRLASVDRYGVVTARTPDRVSEPVTITATALDGSGVTASKTIHIRKTVPPTAIAIDQSCSTENGYYCALNERSLTLKYTTDPEECTTSMIAWTTSDPAVATVDNGVVTYRGFGEVTITATCPNGANSSIRLSIPVGLIRETYHNEQHYSFYDAGQSGNGTKTAHVWHDGCLAITTYMQNATTGRADIKCFGMPLYLHAGNYPILAVKMQDVKDVDAGIKSRNINLDCVGTSQKGTSFKALGGGNNKYSSDLRCSDGSHVFVYDMTKLNFGTGGKAPTDEYIQFSVFQFKYADMKSVDHQITYNLYWVQTFRSMDELESYLTHVDKVSYE